MSLQWFYSVMIMLIAASQVVCVGRGPGFTRRNAIVPLYTASEDLPHVDVANVLHNIPSTFLDSGLEAYNPVCQNTLYRTFINRTARCLQEGKILLIPALIRDGLIFLQDNNVIFVQSLSDSGPESESLTIGINTGTFSKYERHIDNLFKKREDLTNEQIIRLRRIMVSDVWEQLVAINEKNKNNI